MGKWFILAGMACMFAVEQCLAASVSVDAEEYEEFLRWKAEKKRSKEQPLAPAVGVPVQPPVVVAPGGATIVVAQPAVPVPAVAPAGSAVPAKVEKGDEEPPPPPEPPAADAAEPRRLVRYFCKTWKDKDWERLWWAMSPQYRKNVSLKKFKKLFESDAELNGGLLDENIIETAKTKDGNEGVKLELIFKFPRAQHRFVMAVAERQPGGAFRIVDSPFIPKDLDDL